MPGGVCGGLFLAGAPAPCQSFRSQPLWPPQGRDGLLQAQDGSAPHETHDGLASPSLLLCLHPVWSRSQRKHHQKCAQHSIVIAWEGHPGAPRPLRVAILQEDTGHRGRGTHGCEFPQERTLGKISQEKDAWEQVQGHQAQLWRPLLGQGSRRTCLTPLTSSWDAMRAMSGMPCLVVYPGIGCVSSFCLGCARIPETPSGDGSVLPKPRGTNSSGLVRRGGVSPSEIPVAIFQPRARPASRPQDSRPCPLCGPFLHTRP